MAPYRSWLRWICIPGRSSPTCNCAIAASSSLRCSSALTSITQAIIRVVLDNHSAHISMETLAYLATRPGRFEYVHTPKHGSWLNLVESVFSKMARSFLRHIRVSCLHELQQRILKGIDEMNAHPVRFQWKNFNFYMTET